MIVCDERNPRAVALRRALEERLPEGFSVDGVLLVIGGDGFLLRSVARYGLAPAYLGLNAGHLGFLLNEHDDDWEGLVARLRARAWREYDFPLVEAEITLIDGSTTREVAINDVYLERSTGQAARLALSIDDHEVVGAMVADGLIVATALGSTAYSFSAGSTPHHPRLQALLVTPICPHRPRLSPFALPATSRVRIDVQHADRRPVRVVADGRGVEDVAAVQIAYGLESVRLAYFHDHDFTRHLVRKILVP